MAIEREASLESHFMKRVRLVGGYSIKLAPMEAGVPDRLVMFPGGRMFLVELKAEDGALSPKQRHWHQRALHDYGVPVHVVTGRAGVLNWLRWVIDSGSPRRRTPARRTA